MWYLAPGSKSASLRAIRWGDALVLLAECPPSFVVVGGLDLAGEDLPAPLVDEQTEGQESDLVECGAELERDVRLGGRDGVDEADLFEISGRDGEGDGVSDGFVGSRRLRRRGT